jgi:hypothetical protein
MITSKQIVSVSEEYLLNKNVNGHELVVYLNPTKSEFQTLYKQGMSFGDPDVRFVADAKTQRMYACTAYLARHADIRKLVGLSPYSQQTPYAIDGYLHVSGNSVKMYSWEDFQLYLNDMKFKKAKDLNKHFATVLSYRWTWLDKYADCSKYIFQLQMEFEDLLVD